MLPIRVETIAFRSLPDHYRDAVLEAVSIFEVINLDNCLCRIETYSVGDLLTLMAVNWGWNTYTPSLDKSDKQRIQKIKKLLLDGKPQWPYVSYYASTMKELIANRENHGDGYHRVIAAAETGKKTIDVLFL